MPGRGGRVVECSGLENRRTGNRSVSSNLTHAVQLIHTYSSVATNALRPAPRLGSSYRGSPPDRRHHRGVSLSF
jgi:hypothetical protein